MLVGTISGAGAGPGLPQASLDKEGQRKYQSVRSRWCGSPVRPPDWAPPGFLQAQMLWEPAKPGVRKSLAGKMGPGVRGGAGPPSEVTRDLSSFLKLWILQAYTDGHVRRCWASHGSGRCSAGDPEDARGEVEFPSPSKGPPGLATRVTGPSPTQQGIQMSSTSPSKHSLCPQGLVG